MIRALYANIEPDDAGANARCSFNVFADTEEETRAAMEWFKATRVDRLTYLRSETIDRQTDFMTDQSGYRGFLRFTRINGDAGEMQPVPEGPKEVRYLPETAA